MNIKKREKEYFDREVSSETHERSIYSTSVGEAVLRELNDYSLSLMGDLFNKQLLFYGCGVSIRVARELSEKGAIVHLIDISARSIEKLSEKIKELKLDNKLFTAVMDCEKLGFKDKQFDFVYGRAILHHLEIDVATTEVTRVLKAGGEAVFIEPLGENPIVNLYRRLTPQQRTKDEKPLKYSDLKTLTEAKCSAFSHKEFNLLTTFSIALESFLKMPGGLNWVHQSLKGIDDLVLSKFTFLRKYCWNSVIYFKK